MKRLLCLLLALVMALTLTACGTGDTGTGGKPLPDMTGKTQEPDGDPAYSDQAQADLDRLRSDLREGGYLFGAANFGYLEQGQTPGEWANAMDPATCAAYRFIPEIPDGQVVGTGGCLLCLVPVDPDATVSVNRIRWHENGDGFEQEEVLYRSETGQPVFLLVEDDPDMPGYSSVQVNIVGDSGFVDWYPTVVGGQLDLANDGQGHYRGCDIAMDGPGAGSDDMDWTPPTVQQLTCTVWDWGGPMEDGRYASGTLTLDGSDARSASLVWQYEDDAVYREIYTGTWSRVDQPQDTRGLLHLKLELQGGSEYDLGRRSSYNDSFPVAVPGDFASFSVLIIDEGQGGTRLPFQTDAGPSVVLFPGAMG